MDLGKLVLRTVVEFLTAQTLVVDLQCDSDVDYFVLLSTRDAPFLPVNPGPAPDVLSGGQNKSHSSRGVGRDL